MNFKTPIERERRADTRMPPCSGVACEVEVLEGPGGYVLALRRRKGSQVATDPHLAQQPSILKSGTSSRKASGRCFGIRKLPERRFQFAWLDCGFSRRDQTLPRLRIYSPSQCRHIGVEPLNDLTGACHSEDRKAYVCPPIAHIQTALKIQREIASHRQTPIANQTSKLQYRYSIASSIARKRLSRVFEIDYCN